ncbi:MAG: DUF4838 domain-containing protein [Bacteroidales bacterium]|nr:DUF4838 domain-containing protein [Bacteroidales bacterium]
MTRKNIISNAGALSLALIAFLFFSNDAAAKRPLFKNGKSSYTIVLPAGASVSEKTAAKELQNYIQQISGASIPLSSMDDLSEKELKKNKIIVGWCGECGDQQPSAEDDSFTVRSRKSNLYIYGGSQRGTMYGAYSFLEKEFGVKWYTPECTVVPQKSVYKLDRLDYSETPAIKYRFVQYHDANRDAAWMAHNRNNSAWDAEDNEYGGISAYWNAHTMGQFIPAGDYFEKHPEYFGVHDGKRIPYGQLCLTNPEVLKICIEKTKKAIKDNPLYWVYSVSQNDNMLPCECDECKALEEKYGGHAGLMVWFVNQVADAIKDEFPDKYIGTFAYQYTRQAPKDIAPRDNVVIRLCSIECDFSHPICSNEANKPFMKDIEDWSKIAPHLFIWDYVVNFNQYLAPYPNFQSLAQNIKTFQEYNAIGIQEEANYQSNGAAFSEMKSWVLSKLLWDPEQDTDTLVNEFINAYYGPAAGKVREYYDLCLGQVKDDTFMGFAFDHNHSIFDDEFVAKSFDVLQEAKKEAAGDEEFTDRVDRVVAQVLFLKVMRNKEAAIADGSRDELIRIMKKFDIRAREWQTKEAFFESIQ